MLDLGDLGVTPPPPENAPPLPSGATSGHEPSLREDPAVLERLKSRGRAANEAGDDRALLQVAKGFLEAERGAVNEGVARMYRLELRRLVSRRQIAEFARLGSVGEDRELAIEVLHHLGADAAEVMMDELVKADSMSERRVFFSTLLRMGTGAEVIMQHLSHPTWFVVRNAADLCGEMRLAAAVPHLARHARHPDERVRKSVVAALDRIGTPEAAESLGRMIKDPSPAVRIQVLSGLHGPRARPLAMPLAAMLATEENTDVLRELLRALGRIGTPEAIQVLGRAAQGEFRPLRRLRHEAAEALSAARALQGTAS